MTHPLRPAVFLDRDGTIIHDRHYLGDPDGVELLPGAAAAIGRLNAAGLPAILVTNQSGIGRGLFSETEYSAVHRRLVEQLEGGGARLDAAYHCPDPPGSAGELGCRKPGAEMFLRAWREHGVDLARSFYVGDRLRDLLPGKRLGGTAILVRSPESELEEAAALPWLRQVDSLAEAVDSILGGRGPIDAAPPAA